MLCFVSNLAREPVEDVHLPNRVPLKPPPDFRQTPYATGLVQQIPGNVSPRSFLLSTFFHFSQKFLYQERHVRYKPTLYRPDTKRNGKSGKEKTLGRHVSCNPL
jgi:hypothetical protein